MRSFDPAAEPGAEVPDPYHGSPADYEEAFELVQAAARGLDRAAGRAARPEAGRPGRSAVDRGDPSPAWSRLLGAGRQRRPQPRRPARRRVITGCNWPTGRVAFAKVGRRAAGQG